MSYCRLLSEIGHMDALLAIPVTNLVPAFAEILEKGCHVSGGGCEFCHSRHDYLVFSIFSLFTSMADGPIWQIKSSGRLVCPLYKMETE